MTVTREANEENTTGGTGRASAHLLSQGPGSRGPALVLVGQEQMRQRESQGLAVALPLHCVTLDQCFLLSRTLLALPAKLCIQVVSDSVLTLTVWTGGDFLKAERPQPGGKQEM